MEAIPYLIVILVNYEGGGGGGVTEQSYQILVLSIFNQTK